MKYLSFVLVLSCLLVAQPLSSQTVLDFKNLQDSIQLILDDTGLPGAQVAVFTGDSLLWNQMFGLADVETKSPVTPETFFRIGSITKNFVSTAILQLVEQGKISLDDDISKYLDDVEYTNQYNEEAPIRIVNLLEHTAGFDDMHMREYAVNGDSWTLKEGIDYHPDNRYARWKPGTHMSYCNSGPPLAAYIVEKVTGQSFDDYVRSNIFVPLGMWHSSLLLTDQVSENLSKGYDADGKTEMPYWHISQRPAGSINSTTAEMSRFVRMLINRGTLDSVQLLSPASIKRMERCETTLAGKAGITAGYGLHNYPSNFKGMEFHGHNGGMMGFLAQASYHPESGYGFVVLVNATNSAIGKISREVVEFLYDAVGQVYPIQAVELTAESEKNMLGYYRSATSRNQMLRAPDYIAGITKVGKDDEGYFVRDQLSATKTRATPVAQHVLMLENENENRSPMVFTTADGVHYAQQVNWMTNLRKTSMVAAFTPLVLTGLTVLAIAILVLWALLWIALAIFGRARRGRWSIRWTTLVLALSIFGFGFFFVLSNEGNVLENLGTLSLYSGGIFVSSVAMVICMAFFIWYRLQMRVEDEGRWFRWVSLLASVLFIITIFFLVSQDLVGLRTWAY